MKQQFSLFNLFVVTTIAGLLFAGFLELSQLINILSTFHRFEWWERFWDFKAVDVLIVGLLAWIAVRQQILAGKGNQKNETTI